MSIATRTALLLIDFQVWIMRDLIGAGGPAAAAAAALILAAARRRSDLVVHVRYLRIDGSDGGAESAQARFVGEIDVLACDTVVTKYGISVFDGTDLHTMLTRAQVGRLVLAGVATESAIEETANSAIDLGYEVQVISDAVAGASPETHGAALERMRDSGVALHTVGAAAG